MTKPELGPVEKDTSPGRAREACSWNEPEHSAFLMPTVFAKERRGERARSCLEQGGLSCSPCTLDVTWRPDLTEEEYERLTAQDSMRNIKTKLGKLLMVKLRELSMVM